MDIKPHKVKSWIFHKEITDDEKEEFTVRSHKLCDLYRGATALSSKGIRVSSIDEKTGIQALEFKARDEIKPGQVALRDSEYIRHGTRCLTAVFDVVSGKLVYHKIEETRKEEDFVAFIKEFVSTDPDPEHVIVLDQLNTHKSAQLVEFVAQYCDIKYDLGKKGKHGILKNMTTRRKFLEDESHKLRFLFTPRHSSWLNQIEIWFGILTRRLLKRLNVNSIERLIERVDDFIIFFNKVMARPFKWTYTGKVLNA